MKPVNRIEFFDELCIKEYDSLLRYATKLLKNREAAEDAVQETFFIAHKRIDRLMASPRPGGWLTKTLVFVIKNTLRNESHVKDLLSQLCADAITTQNTLDLNVFDKYRGIINDNDLKMVIMFCCEGYRHAEIAAQFGLAEGTCRQRISRAIKRLGERI